MRAACALPRSSGRADGSAESGSEAHEAPARSGGTKKAAVKKAAKKAAPKKAAPARKSAPAKKTAVQRRNNVASRRAPGREDQWRRRPQEEEGREEGRQEGREESRKAGRPQGCGEEEEALSSRAGFRPQRGAFARPAPTARPPASSYVRPSAPRSRFTSRRGIVPTGPGKLPATCCDILQFARNLSYSARAWRLPNRMALLVFRPNTQEGASAW